jgi:hypothetical protein
MNVVVHCSDSSFGNAILIDGWHKLRGWIGIGYHLVILNGAITSKVFNKYMDGFIESGRPFDDNNRVDPFEVGAHTKGKNDWIGICLIGKSGQFTEKQRISLVKACYMIKDIFGSVTVSQHSDHDPAKPYCAGLSKSYIEEINNALK